MQVFSAKKSGPCPASTSLDLSPRRGHVAPLSFSLHYSMRMSPSYSCPLPPRFAPSLDFELTQVKARYSQTSRVARDRCPRYRTS